MVEIEKNRNENGGSRKEKNKKEKWRNVMEKIRIWWKENEIMEPKKNVKQREKGDHRKKRKEQNWKKKKIEKG